MVPPSQVILHFGSAFASPSTPFAVTCVSRRHGDAERRGDGVVAGTGEMPAFHHAGRERILGGQSGQGAVECKQAVVRVASRHVGSSTRCRPPPCFSRFLSSS